MKRRLTDPPSTVAQVLPAAPGWRLGFAAVTVLVAVGAAQLGDLVTFLRMVSLAGISAELNPLVAHGARTLGTATLISAKIALIVLVASAFAIVGRSHPKTAGFVATAGMVAGLIGAYSNVLAVIR